MKKGTIFFLSAMLCSMYACSCGKESNELATEYHDDSASGFSDIGDSSDIADKDEEEYAVDVANRTMIAEALGIEESSRNLRFIIGSLHTIGTGQLQSAEAAEYNGEKVLNLVAEDGTNYCVYLSGNGSVVAIKNIDTGEWPIQSER